MGVAHRTLPIFSPLSNVMILVVFSLLGTRAFSVIPRVASLSPRAPSSIRQQPSGLFKRITRFKRTSLLAESSPSPSSQSDVQKKNLLRLMLPVWLSIFVHMLGVGITMSQLPLYITALGASPMQLGLAISGFSAAQMIASPLAISLSNRVGRLAVMRLCLAGNAAASLLTAASSSWVHIAFARILAGLFAAAVPVAQAAVSDMVEPGPATSRALSQVAAATSLGFVAGPAVAGAVSEIASQVFLAPDHVLPKIVFAASGGAAAAVCVLLVVTTAGMDEAMRASAQAASKRRQDNESKEGAAAAREAEVQFAQPLVRWIALMTSWAVTLTVGTYTLFATRFLDYTQRHINANASGAAALAVCIQLWVVPALCQRFGDERTCSAGLATLGVALCLGSLIRVQPAHVGLFLLFRAGVCVAEVANTAMTAGNSRPEKRARNLGLLQSTQAGGRIISPLLAGWMYEQSLGAATISALWRLGLPPGSLPFLVVGSLAALTAPLPLLLRARKA